MKQYNILPILFRMTLQLTPGSVGCSYFFDYLMNNIADTDDMDSKSDRFKINFMEFDNQSKQHLFELLKRQLNYEKQFPHKVLFHSFLKCFIARFWVNGHDLIINEIVILIKAIFSLYAL